MVIIYKLIDPRNNEIKYIGKTVCLMSDRLKVHIFQTKNTKKHTPKELWIAELLNIGLRPKIEMIKKVEYQKWKSEELYQIQEHLKNGHPLTNITNKRHSEEWKKQLSEKMKGNKYSLGTKWTESQRELMKNRKTWNKGIKLGKQTEEERNRRQEKRKQTLKINRNE